MRYSALAVPSSLPAETMAVEHHLRLILGTRPAVSLRVRHKHTSDLIKTCDLHTPPVRDLSEVIHMNSFGWGRALLRTAAKLLGACFRDII